MPSPTDTPGESAEQPFAGDCEMAELMRAHDWSTSDLGPPETWPDGLKSAVSICLNFKLPFALYWGPKYTMFYNDAFRPMVGDKHPGCLGRPGQEVWAEIWHAIGPMWQQIRETGQGVWFEDSVYFMERHGYVEECYFSFNLSAAWGGRGTVGGLVNFATETTYRVLNERRARCARTLLSDTAHAQTIAAVCAGALNAFSADPADVPYGVVYQVHAQGHRAQRIGMVGLPEGHPMAPETIDLVLEADGACQRAVTTAVQTGRPAQATRPDGPASDFIVAQPWPECVRESWVMPVQLAGHTGVGAVLLFGISPRRAFDEGYREFLERLAGHMGAAMANAHAHEGEALRAAQLTELDRAKSAFFDNISHEFRTPLTLLLGHTEEALASDLVLLDGDGLRAVHTNGLRLLNLVNSLLDFSRLTRDEGRRVRPNLVPTDLAAQTASVAGGFRTAIERVGLALEVDCPSLGAPVLVDRELWDRILLNLLSNALKYTQDGTISVSLRRDDHDLHLTIRDTGHGIPADDLPRVFERFYRVAGVRARSHDSTGLGLALVREHARLLGGRVEVRSEVGEGSVFTVSIPCRAASIDGPLWTPVPDWGNDPTDPERVTRAASLVAAEGRGEVVEPALHDDWTDDDRDRRSRVLVVEDNPEMRAHVTRLLSMDYAVRTAPDGVVALEMIRAARPDLVLSDVMMPRLDGVGLLHALRDDPETSTLPVILISARADQEATVDGLAAGADDYLAKPFSSHELRARVRAHLRMARERTQAADAVRAANAELEARVAERTTDLAVALTEMRAFTFSASHDLRTPLRAIDGYSQVLLDDYQDTLDAEALGFLERIRTNAQRMGHLIDAILELGRIGRAPLSHEKVELDVMAREITQTLEAAAPKHRAEIIIEPGLCAEGDARLIFRLLQNLLDNAWKFSHVRPDPRIEFGRRIVGEESVFFVSDNGGGFDMAYADKLFEPFQRLHQEVEARGHGVGLAACREIVRRHGGWISGEGTVDGGATFRFTLPGQRRGRPK